MANHTREPHETEPDERLVVLRYRESAQREEARAEKQDEYAARTVYYARWGVIIQGITFAAACVAAGLLWCELTEMQAQTKAAQDELVMSMRPWLTVKSAEAETPLTFDAERGAKLGVRLTIENIGPSPAIAADIRWTLVMPTKDDPSLDEMLSAICDPAPERGMTIFPKQPTWESGFRFVPRDRVEAAKRYVWTIPGGYTGEISAQVIGCIDYRFSLATAPYRTPFFFNVRPKGNGQADVLFREAPEIPVVLDGIPSIRPAY